MALVEPSAAAAAAPEPLEGTFAEAMRRFEEASQDSSAPLHSSLTALLRDYTALCQREVERLEELLDETHAARMAPAQRDAAEAESTVLRAERNTWYLLEWLYQDWPRVTGAAGADAGALVLFAGDPGTAADKAERVAWSCPDEQAMVDAIFESDEALATAHAALQWLECVAYERAHYLHHQDASPRNSLFRLAAAVDTGGLAPQVDPDAPHRTGLPFDADDEEEDRRLLQSLWQLVRAGRLDKAQELCRTCGQPWRAASLDGGQVWTRGTGTPPVQGALCERGDGAGTQDAWEGNPHRDVWLEACRHLAASAADPHERGIYGALSGDSAAMLAAAQTWEDQAWARLRALVHTRVEATLAGARARQPDVGPRVTELDVTAALCGAAPRPADASARLPAGVTTSAGEAAGNQSGVAAADLLPNSPPEAMAEVQRLLVLDRLRRSQGDVRGRIADIAAHILHAREAAMRELGSGVAAGHAGREAIGGHLLRFAVHAVLFLRHACVSGPPELSEDERAVLGAFSDRLVRTVARAPLPGSDGDCLRPLLAFPIALHASKLPPDEAVRAYSAFLRRFSACLSPQQQLDCLSEAAGALGPKLLCDATCDAVADIQEWWPLAVAEARLTSSPGPEGDGRAFAALHWLAQDVPGEDAAGKRARLTQALVHANGLTAALVEAGQTAQLLVPMAAAASGAGAGVSSGDALAVLPTEPEAANLVPRSELVLPPDWVNDLWTPDPVSPAQERTNNAVAEYFSWNAYLQALAAYHRWWVFVSRHKDPALSAVGQPEGEAWRAELHERAEEAQEAAENALRMPHGWLEEHFEGGVPATGALAAAAAEDTPADPGECAARAALLARLKARCVPQLVELLHSALLETARLDASAEYATRALHFVAEVVADEHCRLYTHFTPVRLRTLLGLLRKSALVALELQANRSE